MAGTYARPNLANLRSADASELYELDIARLAAGLDPAGLDSDVQEAVAGRWAELFDELRLTTGDESRSLSSVKEAG